MTIIYWIVILLQVGVIIYFVRRGKLKAKEQGTKQAEVEDRSYDRLRSLALSVTPFQLKLAIPEHQTLVYGVVMDWNTGETVVTLTTFITGAVNLYLSTGGGVQGGGKNPDAGEAAVRLVTAAQDYVERAVATSNTKELPAEGCVRFYLMTNKGTYVAQEHVKYFDDRSSAWLPLFEKANEVIGEMRGS